MTRRDFLERTATAGVLAGLRWQAPAQSGMFISLNSSLTGKMEWPDFARLASRLHYGGVDVSLDGVRRDGPERTRAFLAELRLKPGVFPFTVSFAGEETAYQDGLKQLPDVSALAAAIGCPRMMAVMPPATATPKAELRPRVKDRLSAISAILARSNVRLGLEFLGPLHFRTRQPHEFIWRMDELLDFATECGPSIGLTLDAWHWHHAGATEADILRAGSARIVHVHVSDAKAQPPEEVRDNQRLMPGEGVIDLVTFFRALAKAGYRDAVSPEPLGRIPSGTSAEEGARLGLETTTAVMKKSGLYTMAAAGAAGVAFASGANEGG
jgi:sugar phosphate isomerase/epimerase